MPETNSSPFLHPAFIFGVFGVVVTLIGLVVWFIRLESKTNTNQNELERISGELEKLKDDYFKHVMDTGKHYNEQFMTEFKLSLERRFAGLEGTLEKINTKMDKLAK